MTDRADLLDLIDRAPGSLRTLQGHWQSWVHSKRVYGEPAIVLSSGSGPPPPLPEIREESTDFWIELPDRWRVVRDGLQLGFTSLDITDGSTRWSGTADRLTGFDRSSTLMGPGAPLEEEIHPAAMLGWQQLGDPTADEREGRRVWTVRAGLRIGAAARNFAPPYRYPVLAAEHSYTIDAETGIILSREATVDGEVCIREELTDVLVDEPIDPALFRPPPEAEVQSETDQQLAMLDANGVDTTGIDRADPQAVRDALTDWMRSRHSGGRRPPSGPPANGSGAPD